MFSTYVIQNKRGKYYIGYSSDVNIRLNWHNSGKSTYTKNKGPWTLVFRKDFKNKSEALKYEKYLKSLKNPKYLKSVIGKQLVGE